MSRTLTEIYNEALQARQEQTEKAGLDVKWSDSKLSVVNILTFVMAALIYTYETILDVFEYDIAVLLSKRVNGTAPYYAEIAKYFQFDDDTGTADKLYFNEDTLQIEYEEVNEEHRIIACSAYQYYHNGYDMTLKVAKNAASDTTPGAAVYEPLTTAQLTAFKAYIDEMKFIGSAIECISLPGDLITIKATVYYNDDYINATQALSNIAEALSTYIKGLGYNATVYYQSLIDAIQDAEYIVSITSETVITTAAWNSDTQEYSEAQILTDRITAKSGYLTFIDSDGESTLNTKNVTLLKNSLANF